MHNSWKAQKGILDKEGDTVIVRPWVVQTDERGDIIWRYSIMTHRQS